jgi:excisionase family DNA binding protein
MPETLMRIEDAPDFLTPYETAQLLRISQRTLENMRHNGNGPSYRKLGGRVLYLRADIMAWANDNERRSTQHK